MNLKYKELQQVVWIKKAQNKEGRRAVSTGQSTFWMSHKASTSCTSACHEGLSYPTAYRL